MPTTLPLPSTTSAVTIDSDDVGASDVVLAVVSESVLVEVSFMRLVDDQVSS